MNLYNNWRNYFFFLDTIVGSNQNLSAFAAARTMTDLSTTPLEALDGFTHTATPTILCITSLTKTVELRTLSFNSLRSFATSDEVSAATGPPGGQINFTNTPFLILPPFWLKSYSPKNLLLQPTSSFYAWD